VKRILIALVVAGGPTLAVAQAPQPQPQPSQADMAAAKTAFQEGDALYKQGKLADAVEKLKESYRLSHNAFLLYNIGHIYDQLGQTDLVLMYFKKFLAEAPANAPMRNDVTARVAELEKQPAEAAKPPVEEAKPEGPKLELKHTTLDSAPPGVPIDLTASVPADANVNVTLYYRGTNDVKFTAVPMQKHGEELAGHIPGSVVAGSWIQYYIEVKDPSDKLVTRNGKSTSPNLIAIDNNAKPHFFEDMVQPGESTSVKPQHVETVDLRTGTEEHVDVVDTGPPFAKAKWIASGSAVAFFGVSLTSYLIAKRQHRDLVSDSVSCGAPPCRQWDTSYDQMIEDRGTTFNTVYKVTLGVGFAASAVAGYFWYRSLSAKPTEQPGTVMITPVIDRKGAGAAAMVRF
jgi:hypothetical protein